MRDASISGLKRLIVRGNTTQVEIAADPGSDEISEALRTFAAGGGGLIVLGVKGNGDSGAISPPRVPDTLEELKKIARGTPNIKARVNATKDGDDWLPYIEIETDAPPAGLPFQALTPQQRRLLARIAGIARGGMYRSDFVASVTHNLGWYVLASGAGPSKRFSGFEETDLHAIAEDGYITLLPNQGGYLLSLRQKAVAELQAWFDSAAAGEAPDDAGAGPGCDVFICHASEDKIEIVEPLLSSLKDSGISTWYDLDQIRWGDSVVGRINEGLQHCRFVLVVLSENFLAKPWARRELESALGEEASSGQLRVLPLLVGSESQRSVILARLPLLADKKYLVWSAQHHRIAAELRSLLGDLEP